ncbi:MAG: 30S ribosomal protein S20, partial [Alphaproteobacteria bacterium]|nr:30S ribosomal protein S20 [Alphaproteobacteria bacterium]
MANSPQARKRVRQTIKSTERNKARRSRIRTFIKQVETAIAAGDQGKAEAALKSAEPEIMRGVSK